MNRLRSSVGERRYIWMQLLEDESGQDLIEYALVAALISLGAVASIKGLAPKISQVYNTVASNLTNDI